MGSRDHDRGGHACAAGRNIGHFSRNSGATFRYAMRLSSEQCRSSVSNSVIRRCPPHDRSSLPPKADVHPRSCYVAEVLQPVSCTATNNVHGCNDLLDHLVGDSEQARRNGEVVSIFAASAAAVLPGVTMTATCRRTSSAAISRNRSSWRSGQRYSIATFWSSTEVQRCLHCRKWICNEQRRE